VRSAGDLDLYWKAMLSDGAWPSEGNLRFFLDTLFGKTDFRNKRVLDIGGGSGLISFYAACRGARDVVCLEPEGEGSSHGAREAFQKRSAFLKLDNVVFRPTTLQAFDSDGAPFDVIVLCNSINHLDEAACMSLLETGASRIVYKELFSKMFALSSHGARLIACDCSRDNFFARYGIRNPFAPTIEWNKHQAPETWVDLLREAGFVNPEIRWTSPNRLRRWGGILLGNRPMAYFLDSHFCLHVDKL
jgi:SAM-dependent methyltransferase